MPDAPTQRDDPPDETTVSPVRPYLQPPAPAPAGEHYYLVRWEIDAHAENPADAALQAFAAITRPDTIATVFDVYTGTGHRDPELRLVDRVDLSDEDCTGPDPWWTVIGMFHHDTGEYLIAAVLPGRQVTCDTDHDHGLYLPHQRMAHHAQAETWQAAADLVARQVTAPDLNDVALGAPTQVEP